MTLTLILKATVLMSVVAAAAALLRRGSAAQRHLVWMLGFIALLALPFVPGLWRPPAGNLATLVATAIAGPAAASPLPWLRWFWMAGAVAALVRLAGGHLRMARTSEVPMAMTWGILRPRIFAPAEGLHQFDLQHEEAHVARRDGLWQFITQFACAVYWFHPLVWWAERRAAHERERACDDLVLESGADPADYAERLVDAARALAEPPLAALAVSGESGLASRVKAILDPAVSRRGLQWRDVIGSLALVALVVVPLSSIVAQSNSVAETKPQLVHKVEPEYSEQARAALIDGPVDLTAVVKADGSFTDVKVVNGLGYGLDEKAVEAIQQWQATPATKDGEPVDSSVQITVNFRLE